MPKSLILSNGNLVVDHDKNGLIRDIYYPHVGLDNNTGSNYVHKIGIFIDGSFSWLDDGTWHTTVEMEKNSLVGKIIAQSSNLQLTITMQDVVYNEKDIFVRKVTIQNDSNVERTLKIFFNQQFEIYGSRLKDTAFYDPIHKVIFHYKGRRVFLVNAISNERNCFEEYSVGILGLEGKEGTFKDAEDGILSKNPIEHGSVDSVLGLDLKIKPSAQKDVLYWIVASRSIRDAYELNNYVISKSPEHLIQTTKDFWQAWTQRVEFNSSQISDTQADLFYKSLLIARTHVDSGGAIIASCDSDMLQHGRDNYSYMWPRDGAFVAMAFDIAGDYPLTKRFFEFCNTILTNDGYFLHKYRPDGALGSSWHPWVRNDEIALPIQEDETALVIFALWEHYQLSRDIEFIESLYNTLIKKAAQFMVSYREQKTGLPLPSYDLWEETFCISTFTSSSVHGALLAAANFAKLLGKREEYQLYSSVAEEIRLGILKHLQNPDGGFYKMLLYEKGEIIPVATHDISSVYGIFKFKVLPINDPILERAVEIAREKLTSTQSKYGIARYEGDQYYNSTNYHPGNPWIISSLWIAQYEIAKAKSKKDLSEKVLPILDWVVSTANPAGILPEQVSPYTNEQLSASPLTWSHAEYIVTTIQLLQKYKVFEQTKS